MISLPSSASPSVVLGLLRGRDARPANSGDCQLAADGRSKGGQKRKDRKETLSGEAELCISVLVSCLAKSRLGCLKVDHMIKLAARVAP